MLRHIMRVYIRVKRRKLFVCNIVLIFLVIAIILFIILFKIILVLSIYYDLFEAALDIDEHRGIVEKFYRNREGLVTSNLGSILFKNIDRKTFEDNRNKNKEFKILIWKYYEWLKKRHINSFQANLNNTKFDPLQGCSVNNCKFSGHDSDFVSADMVVIHLQHGDFPAVEKRHSSQIWTFLTDESPKNTFSMASLKRELSFYADIFNWSMTFRSDADVPAPYGRTIPLPRPYHTKLSYTKLVELIPDWKKKKRDVLATILISNCGVSERMKYLIKIKQYLKVDVHGKCAVDEKKISCPGHFRANCEPMSKYLFYLVFENSLCYQYLTEKIFFHAYTKGAIPIIMGPSIEECEKLLPPNSFLHVDQYESAKDLAKAIINISKDEQKLLSYHVWRNSFQVINEHGYFGTKSKHLCRICEALNYNGNKTKVYDESMLKSFLDPSLMCRN